jgi:penicillin-binding protein 2
MSPNILESLFSDMPISMIRNKNNLLLPEETFVDTKNIPGYDTARFEGALEHPISTRAFLLVGGLCFTLSALLLARAGYISLYNGGVYAARAEENRLQHTTIVPERGVVYARNGEQLAYNVPGFRVVVDTRGAERAIVLPLVAELSEFLEREDLVTLVERHWNNGEIVVELIREWATANMVITHFKDSGAIRVEPTPLRMYTEHPAFSHVLGYVSRATKEDIEDDSNALLWGQVGRSGLEFAYDSTLRGNLGVKIVETNSGNTVLSEGIFQKEERGKSIITSISPEMQIVAYNALMRTVHDRGFTGGSAVVLDAKTGDVLTMASYPGFNLNALSSGAPYEEVSETLTDPRHPLFFRAAAGLYPPASTIKPYLAAAALEEGIISPETKLYTNGRLIVPNPFNPDNPSIFNDWRDHGSINMYEAIAFSSNVYFFTVGGGFAEQEGLGHERIQAYLKRFGFGAKTGVDTSGEETGNIPDEAWKQEHNPENPTWRIGDTYNMSIGQGGLLVTPLQMARGALAIARDGLLLEPSVVMAIADASGNEQSIVRQEGSAIQQTGISKETFAAVKQGMRKSVVEGTARGVSDIPLAIAAKTGTAEYSKSSRDHSWFIGFLPYDDPEIVVAINLENGPTGNLIGGIFVAHELLLWYAREGRELVFPQAR